jgi:hypothetical protein
MASSGKERKFDPSLSTVARLEKFGKIGMGTLVHPDTARWVARVMLFARMEKMMSDDLRSLKSDALPHYKALYELGRKMSPMDVSNVPALTIRETLSDGAKRFRAHYVTSWSTLSEAADHFDEAKLLAAAIFQWADRIHMGTAWFLDAVLMNLHGWRLHNDSGWEYPGGAYMELEHGHRVGGGDMRKVHGWGNLDRLLPVPVVKPYNPSTQTRKAHQADLVLELKRYYAEQEDQFEKAGFQKTILKRARASTSAWVHFEWFIRYQMQGKPVPEIANEYNSKAIGDDAVYKAIRDTAEVLEVVMR